MKPVIAIVGRPNVGKSTIFNRIAGERLSIVEDTPGVTRDRLYASGTWLNNEFDIIDTGGIQLDDAPFAEEIRIQAEIAVEEADVVIMICDVRDGMTNLDQRIAKILHQSKKPVFLAINKVDNPEQRADIYEFYGLGLGDPYPISGSHGVGLGDLLDAAVKAFPNDLGNDEDDGTIKFSLIGRPNVGKSSLVNALLDENRVIVSDIAGTTRDAIDTSFTANGQEFKMIDTAGIRQRGRVYESTEKYSVMRSMRAIDRSDVVLVVLNAEEGIVEQDKTVAGYAHEAGKAIIIVVNKWDTLIKDNHTHDKFTEDIRQAFQFLSYAPIIFVSAKTKQRLGQLPEMIQKVAEHHDKRVSSSVLNQVLMDAIVLHAPPTDKGRKLRLYYMTQVATKPPTFVVFVNDIELMHFSYERFLENQIRKAFGFEGTPIKLIVRERK